MVSCQLYLKIIIVPLFPPQEGALQEAGGLCQHVVTKLSSWLGVFPWGCARHWRSHGTSQGSGDCTSGVAQPQFPADMLRANQLAGSYHWEQILRRERNGFFDVASLHNIE